MFDKMRRRGDFSGYLFILPAMVFFLTFVLYPMIKGVYMSLFRFRGRNESFVGLKNYIDLMTDRVFLQSMSNTLFIVAIAVPIVVILSLFIAINIYNKSAIVRSFSVGFSICQLSRLLCRLQWFGCGFTIRISGF